jgi:O-antigen/teichoic acid export membrane protein
MLRAVPFLLLERQVSFGWVGLLEFIGTLAYYGSAIALTHVGYGAAALVWATVAQAALISLAANIVLPWRPKWVYDHAKIRPLLKFGFAFQGNNVVGFINGAITPVLVGSKLGKEALGLVQFAQGTAWFPTHPVGIVRRVYFPYLSRLQHDPQAFGRELDRATLLCAAPSAYFCALFLGGAEKLVTIIYSEKWISAVPPLYFYSVGFVFSFFGWIGSAAVEAKGKTGQLFRTALITLVVNFSCTVVATYISPTPLAFAAGYCVHLIVSPLLIYILVRRLAPEASPVRRTFPSIIAMAGAAAAGRVCLFLVNGPFSLLAWALGLTLVFLAVLLSVDSESRSLAAGFLEKRRAA